MLPILLSPSHESNQNNGPSRRDLNLPLIDLKAVWKEVIPLNVEGIKKKIFIVVLSEGDVTRYDLTTINKQQEKATRVNVNDLLTKVK